MNLRSAICRSGVLLPTALLGVTLLPVGSPTFAQTPSEMDKSTDVLRAMNGSFESLVKRVSPAVVEVLVTGFGSPEEEDADPNTPSSIGRERSLGSGVIVDSEGYIVTNYHVVKGADRVRVVLTPAPSQDSQAVSQLKSRGRVLPARIVGYSKLIDLAVLKVEATGLPTLPIGRYDRVQKGQIVLAFGSPEGLENSVTFGLVSSVLRQPDPDDPMVYIQTDAAINPGNSGGPLVDIEGNVVGIDTFIYTKSGGNEGIGFAIPGGIVRYAYEQIRKYGRVRRRSIGADVQTVTTELAQGLGLGTDSGVIVSDVYPGESAEHAGLKIQDVIQTLDGYPVDNVPVFTLALYLLNSSDSVQLGVMRGDKKLNLTLPVYEPRNDPSRLSDLGDPKKDQIAKLGIVAISVTPEIAEILGESRLPGGVLVTATVANRLAVDSGLQDGDVVHSLNHTAIKTVDDLRAALEKLQPGDPAAMLVERNGKLTYVTFEME